MKVSKLIKLFEIILITQKTGIQKYRLVSWTFYEPRKTQVFVVFFVEN